MVPRVCYTYQVICLDLWSDGTIVFAGWVGPMDAGQCGSRGNSALPVVSGPSTDWWLSWSGNMTSG